MNKSNSAKCEHVKRKLRAGEKLTGKILELALDCIPNSEDTFFNGVKVREK